MNTLRLWQASTLIFCLAAIAGWWRVQQGKGWQQNERASNSQGLASTNTTTSLKVVHGKMEARGPGSEYFSDTRSAEFWRELADTIGDAKPGQSSARFLQLAEMCLQDSNEERVRLHFGLLMQKLRPEDAGGMHELFLRLHSQGRSFSEYGLFAKRWGAVDGAGALGYLLAKKDPLPRGDFDAIMMGWGSVDPQAGLAWIRENPNFADHYKGLNALMPGWAKKDANEFTKWLLEDTSLKDTERHRGISDVFIERLYSQGMDGLRDWMSGLPNTPATEQAIKESWRRHVSRFERLDAVQAKQMWDTMGQQSWFGIADLDAWFRSSQTYPEAHKTFLKNLAGDDIQAKFQVWGAKDPTATSKWLATNNNRIDETFRKQAILGLVNGIQDTNPEDAAIWKAQIREQSR